MNLRSKFVAIVAIALLVSTGFAFSPQAASAAPLTSGLWRLGQGSQNPSDQVFVSPADSMTVQSVTASEVTLRTSRGTCVDGTTGCPNTTITLGAPSGNNLTVGSYINAVGVSGTANATLRINTDGGNNYSGGSFVIDDVSITGSTLNSFSARYTLSNSYIGYDFEGQVSYNSTVDFTPLTIASSEINPPLGIVGVGQVVTTDITITNSGTGTRTNVGASPTFTDEVGFGFAGGGFSIASNTCGTLTAGQSCVIRLRIAPTTRAIYSTELSFTDGIRTSANPNKIRFTVRGALGSGGGYGATFDTVRANYLDSRTVTISNSIFSQPREIVDVTVTGANPEDFFYDPASDCLDGPVATGDDCTIDVYFLPTRAGKRTAVIKLIAPTDSPLTIAVSGTGSVGYVLQTASGQSYAYGDATASGNIASLNKPIVAAVNTPTGEGTWRVASDGGIFTSGDAQFYGSTGNLRLNQPIVGMATTLSGEGYWLVAADGGIFSFGDARFYGSTGALKLNKPIVGMASTASGDGYWLVASDGGIFSFGDAQFYGSTGALTLNKPIVGMATTVSGEGYWMVASDGGVFSFGDAQFYGSTGALKLNQPIVSMLPSPSGRGYWFVAKDGGVFSFGDADFIGAAASSGNKDFIGIVSPSSYF